MDLSNDNCNHNREAFVNVFSRLPANTILDRLTTMFASSGRSNSQEREQESAILKFFRTLSVEDISDSEDGRITDLWFGDVLNHNEESPTHLISLVEEATTACSRHYNGGNGNNVQGTAGDAGIETVQTENNSNGFYRPEEFVSEGESERTTAVNGHTGSITCRCTEDHMLDTHRREQNRCDLNGRVCGASQDELRDDDNTQNEDAREDCDLAEGSVAERGTDQCTEPKYPRLSNRSANMYFQAGVHLGDDAEERPREGPRGEDLSDIEGAHGCKSLDDPISGVLTRRTFAEQPTFDTELDGVLSDTWSTPNGPSDKSGAVPHLTGLEPAVQEAVMLEADDEHSDEEEDDGMIKGVDEHEREAGKGDLLPAGLTSDVCQPVSPKSTETTHADTLPFASFPSSGPLPGSTVTRTTFYPTAPPDKPMQLPALFSGLRVLRKGVSGPEHDTVAQIKSKRGLVPNADQTHEMEPRSQSFLEQISQLLNRAEKLTEEREEGTPGAIGELRRVVAEAERGRDEEWMEEEEEAKRDAVESEERSESPESARPPLSSAEAAFDAFKAFFTPKPLRKDFAEKFDLEAARRKMRNNKDLLKSSNKTPLKKSLSESEAPDAPGDGDERTPPGRLHAVWPPLKEEKVGLKYTEAEHQAALLQLKRECKDEVEQMQEDYGRSLSRLREDHMEEVSHLERTLAHLQTQIALGWARRRADLRDAAASTEDDVPCGAFRAVCVQMDRRAFVGAIAEGAELRDSPDAQHQTCPPKIMKSLWNSLEQPDLINSGEFEELFAKVTTPVRRKPLSEMYEKKAKTRKVIKLLDGKRSQAVGILISSLHLEMTDIKKAVLTVDGSSVDVDTIEALYENRAQTDELKKICHHYQTSDQDALKRLDKPEQFLYELSQIPDFAGRARCIIFQAAFTDGIASVRCKSDVVASVCTDLQERASVREVLGLVLALGNHMNGGSGARGQADGFGLEILPKLKDVRSRDNQVSLVDYVVLYYLENLDQHAGTDQSVFPLPEPQDVFLAGQVKFDDLTRDLGKLGRDLTACEKDVLKVSSDSPEDQRQPFKDKMEAFLLEARREHTGASNVLMATQKRFQELVRYFGLRPRAGETEVTPGPFFMLWFEFCTDVKSRWKKMNKSVSSERLKEAQMSVRRITAEKKVQTRTRTTTTTHPNSLKERLRQKEANQPAH